MSVGMIRGIRVFPARGLVAVLSESKVKSMEIMTILHDY
jgi:hypothetical protein